MDLDADRRCVRDRHLAFVVLGGFVFANKYGYGLSKTWIGIGMLCISIVRCVYRRRVQDGLPLRLREAKRKVPEEVVTVLGVGAET